MKKTLKGFKPTLTENFLWGTILLIGGLSPGGQILLEMLSQRRAFCSYALKDSFRDAAATVHVYAGEKESREILRSPAAICRALPTASLHILPELRHGAFSVKHSDRYADAIRQIISGRQNFCDRRTGRDRDNDSESKELSLNNLHILLACICPCCVVVGRRCPHRLPPPPCPDKSMPRNLYKLFSDRS